LWIGIISKFSEKVIMMNITSFLDVELDLLAIIKEVYTRAA